MLLYEPGRTQPTRVGNGWRTDDCSRAAIEAFTALRLDLLADAISERLARLRPRKRPISDTWDLAGGNELRDFLMTFGPLFGGTGATFPVRNPRAESYEQQAAEAKLALAVWRDSGHDPSLLRRRRRTRQWMVSFEGWAQGRHGSSPDVTEVPPDYGSCEPLPRLQLAQRFLATAVDLADALANAQHWTSERAERDRVRDLFLANGGGGTMTLDGTTRWRRVIRDIPDGIRRVAFSEAGASAVEEESTAQSARPWAVDWLLAGRMVLADMIGRHVQWAQLYLRVDDVGSLTSEWHARSLEEIMYVQLLEHVQRLPRKHLIELPYWPLPRCGYCDGVILGRHPRKPASRFGNRWHRGPCRKAGQMHEARST